MSFQPILPMSGYAGWMFLNRTLDTQQTAHKTDQVRNTEHFAEKIGEIRTAEDLVADHQLLEVALGAFGLGDDIDNKFFIRKVLEGGTSDSTSLANKLSDKSYLAMTEAFGFGEGVPPRTGLTGFASEITEAYETRQFEIAVGDQNDDFRLALAAQREVAEIAEGSLSVDGKWYSVMGSSYLRSVFETTLGLPSSFSSLDLDDQLKTFKAKADKAFGSEDVAQFSDPEKLDKLIQTFLLRSELEDTMQQYTSANTALMLLSSMQSS